LLLFENGDLALPIIIGVIATEEVQGNAPSKVVSLPQRDRYVKLDGERFVVAADKEIVLQCGRSSISLHADGTVVIKGRRIVSRASETNKIKGGSVAIN